jgi:hypothetical protein
MPPNIGRKYNVSRPEEMLSVVRRAFRGGIIRKLWHRKIGKEKKEKVYYMMRKLLSVVPKNITKTTNEVSQSTEKRLISFFESDVKSIEKKFSINTPWSNYVKDI